MSLKDHLGPKKDWNAQQWLDYAHIHKHNPWISDEDREYYDAKYRELINNKNGKDP